MAILELSGFILGVKYNFMNCLIWVAIAYHKYWHIKFHIQIRDVDIYKSSKKK